jgi:small-conductance mechanosensitive channel
MSYLQAFWNSIFASLPSVISAVLLLLIALVVAWLAKSIVVKALEKTNAEKYTDKLGLKDEVTGSSVEFLGKLVFFIVFLLFLPGVLDKLGLQNVSAPIASMVSQFLNYIPNILAAVIILTVGLFVAKLAKQLLTPVLKKLNVDKVQEKAGISSTESTAISSVLAYVVYVLILIPAVIAALQVLNISAISIPAIAMLDKIISFLPNIFVAIAIVLIGAFIARIAGKLLTEILSGVGTDSLLQKAVTIDKTKLQGFSLSKAIGDIVKYILILLFVVEAVNVLKLEILQFVGAAIIAYLPLASTLNR